MINQANYTKLLTRINHLNLLIGQVKSESESIASNLPKHLGNQIEQLNLKMEIAYAQLRYTAYVLEDWQKQQTNEPLIIKEGG